MKPVNFSEKQERAAVAGDDCPELQNWPIQLKLIGTGAPYLNDADILLAADCTAFSAVSFHSRFIKGKKVIIGCPKLDNAQEYFQTLTEMFKQFSIKSVSVVRMEVPAAEVSRILLSRRSRIQEKIFPTAKRLSG